MPIKDKEKRREYQRELMRQKRAKLKMLDPNQGLTEKVSPNVSPDNFVSPMLDQEKVVSPQMLDPKLRMLVLVPVVPTSKNNLKN